MTSLDMVGFSLSLMRLPADRAARLDAPHTAPAWPALPAVHDSAKAPMPMVRVRPTQVYVNPTHLEVCVNPTQVYVNTHVCVNPTHVC
jgi:hypothetical protein